MAHSANPKTILGYPLPFPSAFPAASTTSALSARKNAGIRLIERMSVSAVRFQAIVSAWANAKGWIFATLLPAKGRCLISTADLAGAPTSGEKVKVLPRVGMSLGTMRFPGVLRKATLAAQNILACRDRFKVPRIDTGAISAQMIDMLSRLKWPDKKKIGSAAGRYGFPVQVKIPISIISKMAGPIPAPCYLVDDHSRKENSPALSVCFRFRHIHIIPESGVF